MERAARRGWWMGWSLAAALLVGPGAAHAQATACAVDFDGNGVASLSDWSPFVALWVAGSTLTDLNGDNVVDIYDAYTFGSYLSMPVCPWNADYQYNRSVDPVDQLFFGFLYGAGSLRADLNGDGALSSADFTTFYTAYNNRY